MGVELVTCFFTGCLLGLAFFGGLWWTVRKAMTAQNPALWFFSSLLLRMSIMLVGLYWVMADDWRRMIAALVGVILTRILLTRLLPENRSQHAS